jgi:acetylornithine deacetylase/succinyl-diaminopimelate desuccinylase-like protein
MANPIQAMGRAIAKIDAFEVPSQPKTTFNVGRVGGGTSVNAIPFEAWMEVDLRSSEPAALKALETLARRIATRPVLSLAVQITGSACTAGLIEAATF